MNIELRTKSKLLNFEAKLDLSYKRKRTDYKNLLIEIKQGAKLTSIFPKSVANAMTKRLRSMKLIDDGNKITEYGESIILNPKLPETETGSFSVSCIQYHLGSNSCYLIPNLQRKLSKNSRKLSPNPLLGFDRGNHMVLDHEIVTFDTMKHNGKSSKVYIDEEPRDFELLVDLGNMTFSYGSKALALGEYVGNKMKDYSLTLLDGNAYGEFDFDSLAFKLNNGIQNLTLKEVLDGQIDSYKNSELTMSNIPFVIEDEETAKEYLYKVAYSKLQEDYYSLSDLNDIFINELFASGVFSESVQKRIYDFTYELNGFANYLKKDEYEVLQYKLDVLELLLGFNLVTENADFAKVKNYKQLTSTFKTFVPAKQIEECYVVMGYPFGKNKRNKFPEFYNEFSKIYKDVKIIKKGNTNQKEDKSMIEIFKTLDVPVYNLLALKEHYHDRYIIFKQKNNQYKVYLVTSEIGQFFKSGSNDKMGLIKELDYNEIKRSNQSNNLIKIIERGIENA